MNSPWARLITPIIPKMMASPTVAKTMKPKLLRNWKNSAPRLSNVDCSGIATDSNTVSRPPMAWCLYADAHWCSLDVVDVAWDVLGRLVFLTEVTARAAFDLLAEEARADATLAIEGDLVVLVGTSDPHLVFHVVGRTVKGQLARGRADIPTLFEHFDDGLLIEGACLFDGIPPEVHREVVVLGLLVEVVRVRPPAVEVLDEGAALTLVAQFFHVADAAEDVGQRWWVVAFVLEALSHRRRRPDRDIQIVGRPLVVEILVVRTDEHRHDEIGVLLLDAVDDRREVGLRKRNVLFADDVVAVLLGEDVHPVPRELAEVVVGGDDVDVFAVLVGQVGGDDPQLLAGGRAHREDRAVTDAALVLGGVEVKLVVFVDNGPDRLTRCAGVARPQRVDLVLQNEPLGEFLVAVIVRLWVGVDDLDFLAENPAFLVDFLDSEPCCLPLRGAVELEVPRAVLQ